MEVSWITAAGAGPPPTGVRLAELPSRDAGVLWIDLVHTDQAGMDLIGELIEAKPPDLQECHARTPVPTLHGYHDHYFSAINGLVRGADGRLYFRPLKIFFNQTVLVTVLGPRSAALTEEASRQDLSTMRRDLYELRLRPGSAFELVTEIRFRMLRGHEELVASAARRVAALERRVVDADPVKAEAVLEDLFGLRHDLQMIRTNAGQIHELYVHLLETLGAQPGLMPLDVNRLNDLRRGFSHLQNSVDLEREYLQEVLDMFQTRVSTELNRFVRKITAWGSIGIAWTVMVGVYGMNFTHMPALDWTYGYALAIGLMALVGLLLAVLFRRHGWL